MTQPPTKPLPPKQPSPPKKPDPEDNDPDEDENSIAKGMQADLQHITHDPTITKPVPAPKGVPASPIPLGGGSEVDPPGAVS